MPAHSPSQAQAVRYSCVWRTHPGKLRPYNEDRVLVRTDQGLWAIADGMGGHQSGERAAAMLIDALGAVEHGGSGYAYLSDLVKAAEGANTALFAPIRSGSGSTCGATLVALLTHGGHLACLWAGDSRAYRLRNGGLTLLTHDHSLVQELIDGGLLAETDRRRHPNANVVTRAVGAAASLELDRHFDAVLPGDVFLLCSDGLTACVDDGEIAGVLLEAAEAEAADTLLRMALARNAPDNVSFIIVRCD